MKNILVEREIQRFKNLINYDPSKAQGLLSESDESYLIMESAQSEATAAARAFKAIHKGNWNNMTSGQVYQYAGNEFFFTQYVVAPSQAKGGVLMPEQSINIIKIGKSKYGCPIPVWLGSVWVKANGTALAPTIDQPLTVMGDESRAGWKGFNPSWYDGYYLNTETFSTYCTNFGNAYGTQFDTYIKQNLTSFENQPGGLAGKVWLAIKPSIDRAKGTAPAPTPVVKKN
jgi:hypothetical protein